MEAINFLPTQLRKAISEQILSVVDRFPSGSFFIIKSDPLKKWQEAECEECENVLLLLLIFCEVKYKFVTDYFPLFLLKYVFALSELRMGKVRRKEGSRTRRVTPLLAFQKAGRHV